MFFLDPSKATFVLLLAVVVKATYEDNLVYNSPVDGIPEVSLGVFAY